MRRKAAACPGRDYPRFSTAWAGQTELSLVGLYLIDSAVFGIAWRLALLVTGVFWIALAFWVYRDARHRVSDPLLVATATLLAVSAPFLGPLAYLLFRPPELLVEVRLRDAELKVLEEQLATRAPSCPVCRAGIEPDFRVCPVCTTPLKQACANCNAALEPVWQVCPWCIAPVGAVVVEVDLDTALTREVKARK